MKNKVRDFRKAAQLTQRELAEKVGTSQQQIQRIETGRQTVRFETAAAICAALGKQLDLVFPAAKQVMARVKRHANPMAELALDPQSRREMAEAGIDTDPAIWTLKLLLRNGITKLCRISSRDRDRFFSYMGDREDEDRSALRFFLFDTSEDRCVVNLNHVLFAHTLFDPPSWSGETKPRAGEAVRVFLATEKEPLSFDVEPESNELREDEDLGQIQYLLTHLENFVQPGGFVSFQDVDGETAFFRADEIAMIEVPEALFDEFEET